VIQEDGVGLHTIKGESDFLFGKEGLDPGAKCWWKAKVAEDMDNLCDIDVVEEALYVEKYHSCYKTGLDGGLNVVD